VEAVQPHPASFLRNSHHQSAKLEFVVRSTAGYGSVQAWHKRAHQPRRSHRAQRISLIGLRFGLALGLERSSALPHHPYPKLNHENGFYTEALLFHAASPFVFQAHCELAFQEKNISAWQKN